MIIKTIDFQSWWCQKWLAPVLQYLCLLQSHLKPSHVRILSHFFLSSSKKDLASPLSSVTTYLSEFDYLHTAWTGSTLTSLFLHPLCSPPQNTAAEFWPFLLSIGLLVYYSFTVRWRPVTFSFIVVLAFLSPLLFHISF